MTNASEVLSSIQSAFPAAVSDGKVESDDRLWVTVDSKKIRDVCKYMTDKLGFDHYAGSAGVDWIARNEMEVVEIMASYGIHNVVAMLRLKRHATIHLSLPLSICTGMPTGMRERLGRCLASTSKGTQSCIHFSCPIHWLGSGPGERISRAIPT